MKILTDSIAAIKKVIEKEVFFNIVYIIVLLVLFGIYITYDQVYVGASDWYGYYEGAQLLKKGRVEMEVGYSPVQYPCIAPLSYFEINGRVLPQYPPGYPLLMAIAGLVGMEFYVTPLLGILSVLIMFLLIRQYTDKWIAASFSILWGLSPIVVYGSTSVMSDLVAAFFVILSFYLYTKGRVVGSAVSLAYSLTVRPANVLFCLVFLPRLIKDRKWLNFGFSFAVPAALYGIYNWLVYGVPWKTGYGDFVNNLSPAVFGDHFVFYLKELYFQFSPVILALAIFAFLRRTRKMLFYVVWFGAFLLFYSSWIYGGDLWWWTRFLLPAFPALFILAAVGMYELIAVVRSKLSLKLQGAWSTYVLPILVSICVIGVGWYYVDYGVKSWDIWKKDRSKLFYDASKEVSTLVPPGCVVGSLDFSGVLRLYGKLESFNYENPTCIRFMEDMLKQNIPVYLVIEPWHKSKDIVALIFDCFEIKRTKTLKGYPDLFLYEVKAAKPRSNMNL